LGYVATELLINSLEGIDNINNHKIIDCRLIERNSLDFEVKK
jgi:DNA-binding LacI/PurR family transcriptional regulator